MKSLYKILTVSTLLIFLGCGNSEKVEESDSVQNDNRVKISKAQFNHNNMAFSIIEEKVFPTGIKVNGIIDVPPENKAVVSSITGGYIKTIPLLVGDIVKKGQKVVTIESPEFVQMQQEYLEIKEQQNYLKSEFERQKTMFNENIVSKKVYLKAESQYNTANAKYRGLKKQLAMLNISSSRVEEGVFTSVVNLYSPISGSITKVNASKGMYVSSSTSILEIIDNSHVHIELSVFEKDIMTIKKDQKIVFNIPESSDKNFEASVYLVGTSIQENRTIIVHAHPKDETQKFLTGMFVKAEIITDSKTVMALPENTIVESDSVFYILVLDEEINDNYYFNQLKVQTGNTTNGYTEIIDNNLLDSTDKVIIKGAFSLIGND
ncbi:efflux RND transporter periplasmic adaptor subunit [Winogradskyella sp.]|uniref:efflux RND transporter periplasmic adaptor subunit n=1 Tax=Winogradskyella sp. TaxID=1883156 RepID=UPI0025E7599B|nr:efflux RND transporter periplasmic adaptor subunit [Winogradskyella sp.]